MVVYPLIGIPIRFAFALAGLVVLLANYTAWQTIVLAVGLWPIAGTGVTAGAHRLWTHGSYKPTVVMEALLIFMFSMADQGRIVDWSTCQQAESFKESSSSHMGCYGYQQFGAFSHDPSGNASSAFFFPSTKYAQIAFIRSHLSGW